MNDRVTSLITLREKETKPNPWERLLSVLGIYLEAYFFLLSDPQTLQNEESLHLYFDAVKSILYSLVSYLSTTDTENDSIKISAIQMVDLLASLINDNESMCFREELIQLITRVYLRPLQKQEVEINETDYLGSNISEKMDQSVIFVKAEDVLSDVESSSDSQRRSLIDIQSFDSQSQYAQHFFDLFSLKPRFITKLFLCSDLQPYGEGIIETAI